MKTPAANWFGASGGVVRPTLYVDFQLLTLVRAVVRPSPAAKPLGCIFAIAYPLIAC